MSDDDEPSMDIDAEIGSVLIMLEQTLEPQTIEQIDWLIFLKVTKAIEALADRVQDASGIRP